MWDISRYSYFSDIKWNMTRRLSISTISSVSISSLFVRYFTLLPKYRMHCYRYICRIKSNLQIPISSLISWNILTSTTFNRWQNINVLIRFKHSMQHPLLCMHCESPRKNIRGWLYSYVYSRTSTWCSQGRAPIQKGGYVAAQRTERREKDTYTETEREGYTRDALYIINSVMALYS